MARRGGLRNNEEAEAALDEPRADLQVQPFTIQELMAATMGPHQRDRPKPLKPPKWEETQNIREYLQLFQTIRNHNEWTAAEAVIQLRCTLTGPAQQTALAYPDYDYDELTEELLNRYATDPKDARFEIRRLKREKGMTP